LIESLFEFERQEGNQPKEVVEQMQYWLSNRYTKIASYQFAQVALKTSWWLVFFAG
jgi:hypothetical protein